MSVSSREPVPSRFPAVCRGSSADCARRNQGDHLALPFLDQYLRAKAESFALFLTSGPPLVLRAEVRAASQGRTAQTLRDAAEKVQGSVKKLAMSSFPLNSHEYPHDSEEYAAYLVLLEGILRAFQLSTPSLRLSPTLCSTLRKRAHREEARIRSTMTRCVRRLGTILKALTCVTLAALFDVFFEKHWKTRPTRTFVLPLWRAGAPVVLRGPAGTCGAIEMLFVRRAQAPRHRIAAMQSVERFDSRLLDGSPAGLLVGRDLTRSCAANITCALTPRGPADICATQVKHHLYCAFLSEKKTGVRVSFEPGEVPHPELSTHNPSTDFSSFARPGDTTRIPATAVENPSVVLQEALLGFATARTRAF